MPMMLRNGHPLVLLLAAAIWLLVLVANPVAAGDGGATLIIDDLNRWSRDHLQSSHRLAVSAARQVHAAIDIQKDETVLFVPRKYWIDEAYAAAQGNRDRIAEALSAQKFSESRDGNISQLAAAAIVAYQLLLERNNAQSQWSEYIASLPAQIDLPLAYSDTDLARLAGSPVFESTKRTKLALQSQWHVLRPLFQEQTQAELSYDAWSWAMSVVISRAFAYRSGWALIPVADMLDHSNEPLVSYSLSANGLAVVATHDLKEGQRVFGSYGTGSNAHYLQQFGFAQLNNPADTISIAATTPSCPFGSFFPHHASLSQIEMEDMLDAYGFGGTLSFVLNSNLKSQEGIFAYARSMVRGERSLAISSRPREELINVDKKALNGLAALFRCLLQSYQTSLSDDLAELQTLKQADASSRADGSSSSGDDALGSSSNNSVQYNRLALLIGEKTILSEHLKTIDERIERLARREKLPPRQRPRQREPHQEL